MVSLNSINILLILICLLLRFSNGHSLQVQKSTAGTDVKLQAARVRSVNADEEQQKQEEVVGEMERRILRFGGRKMESRSRRLSHEHGIVAEASSTTSNSHYHKVHCIETRRCVKRKFSRPTSPHSNNSLNMSGFVSWNADYNVPRPHPPRNN